MTNEKLAEIAGHIRIYDNRVAERDVRALLDHVRALREALAAHRRCTTDCHICDRVEELLR